MRTLTILSFFLLSITCYGQWEFVSVSEDGEYEHYYNPSRTTRTGDIVKTWVKSECTNKYNASAKTVMCLELDMKNLKYRFLDSTFYDWDGNVTFTSSEKGDWIEIVPESIIDALYRRIKNAPKDSRIHQN